MAGTLTINALAGHIALKKPNPTLSGYKAYDDYMRGTNLVRKAAQLVGDIERARTAPGFNSLFEGTGPEPRSFEQLLSEIRKKLDTDQSFSLSVTNITALLNESRVSLHS